MATITLIEKTHTIRKMTLASKEACPIDNCGHAQGCRGRDGCRDNEFFCNLQELIALYDRNSKK